MDNEPETASRQSRPRFLETGAAGFEGRRPTARAPHVAALLALFVAAPALLGFGANGNGPSASPGSVAIDAADQPPDAQPPLFRSDFPPEANFKRAPKAKKTTDLQVSQVASPKISPPVPKPKRLTAGREAFRNAAPPPAYAPGQPLLAVVIDDLGFDPSRTRRVTALPGPLTLAFLPYAKNVAAQARESAGTPHELLLHMPMEPLGEENPGPGALRVADSPAMLRRKLAAALDAVPGIVGLNNHMGSRFTGDPDGMALVAKSLKDRGMLFLDSRTSGRAIGAESAQAAGVSWAVRDVFIDDDPSPKAVARQLRQAERVARRYGRAVAIGHPYNSTLDALERFLPAAQDRGIALAPISEVARQNRLEDEARFALARAR